MATDDPLMFADLASKDEMSALVDGIESNSNLGPRLEFSINLGMIKTDHERYEPPLVSQMPSDTPRPHLSRRRTLRNLLSTHARRLNESCLHPVEEEKPEEKQQVKQVDNIEFQLQLTSLPSPLTSFTPRLNWSSESAASIAEADSVESLQPDPLDPPTGRRSPVRQHMYDGMEPISEQIKDGDDEHVADAADTKDEARGAPPQRNRSLMFKPLLDVAAVGALIDTYDGREAGKKEPEPSPAAPSSAGGLKRSLIGSLRRAAAITASVATGVATGRSRGSQPSAVTAGEPVESGLAADAAAAAAEVEGAVAADKSKASADATTSKPQSREICPIETIQPDDDSRMVTCNTDRPATGNSEKPAPSNTDKPTASKTEKLVISNTNKHAEIQRNVRRRAGTLNLGNRDPIRHDKLKHAPPSLDNLATTPQGHPLKRRYHSQRISPAHPKPAKDCTTLPGYIPIAVSLKSSRSRQFLLHTPLGEFEVQRTLGQGSYGKVKLMRSALSRELFAVKIIKRYPAHKHKRSHHEYRKAKTLDKRVVREANLAAILGQLHPHIVPLHDFRVTDTHFYLFYAYVNGVTLAERVGSAGLVEEEARAVFKPVVETIAFCHQYSVIHRDIKLENVLIDYADETENAWPLMGSQNSSTLALSAATTNVGLAAAAGQAAAPGASNQASACGSQTAQSTLGAANASQASQPDFRTASVFDGRVKLIDFGLANFFDGTSLMETFCGSLPYTAPEILRGDAYVGPEIDVWSLGVLLYVMLTGQFPFEDPAQAKNFDKIMAGDFPLRPSMSRELQDLLLQMLEPNAKRRITIRGVLHHPWLMSAAGTDVVERAPRVPGICCHHHPYPTADGIHDRRTLLLPGPSISPLVAREVATCLDRPLDDVTRILHAAMANGRPHSASTASHPSLPSAMQWPLALQEFYTSSSLVQVPNSPVVSVYALVLQQIGMRRYYLELPATDECVVKGGSSSTSNAITSMAGRNASTMSSSSQLTRSKTRQQMSSQAAGTGGLRDMLIDDTSADLLTAPAHAQLQTQAQALLLEPEKKSRTLVTRLTSQIGQLVSLTGNLINIGGSAQSSQQWQTGPSSGAKLKSARALMAHEITQSVMAPQPLYVQPLSAGTSMPSLPATEATLPGNHKPNPASSLTARLRSTARPRTASNSLTLDSNDAAGLRIRHVAAPDTSDARILLPAELSGASPEHILGLLSALLKTHEIAHTFVETRRMPVQHALDSSAYSLKTMAAMMASAYPTQQEAQKVQEARTAREDAEASRGDSDAGEQRAGNGQLRSMLYTMFSRSQLSTPLQDTPDAAPAPTPAPASSTSSTPKRRLTQLPSQLREKVHRRATVRKPGPSPLAASIVHPAHIQNPPPAVVTTVPVKHATSVVLAQYSPSLNRWRETEVVEYYSCSVRIELVSVAASNLRHHRVRYALLVDRMTGHKGKFALFRIFLQRMVVALPSLAPEPFGPRPAIDPMVTVL
ncbi:Serine/threonine-protein kinase [Coemansia erecta]|uniref:Serine/threonine-protein kinase n=1 Tax=Coemansia erecta TaxID=147472 RepID=A0A9W8CSX5_9FUNG|nr:Serine/threonine-protein kinase [Coemansia erecta]